MEVVGLNLKDTELCLGLPGSGSGGGGDGGNENSEQIIMKISGKRGFSETIDLKLNLIHNSNEKAAPLLQQENMKTSSIDKSSVKPPAKTQVVGWPPVRSFRKNIMTHNKSNDVIEESEKAACSSPTTASAFVKVSMDGAPYLRKVDLKMYKSYQELSNALAKMFSSFTMGNYGTDGMIDFMNESKLTDQLNSSEYVPTYEDKDGDWMLVGDVPWE
ncbi:hypothetical protein RD792_017438 [Penstemon davidsonii]|uniref:Auxin-responsive protein n=1 Tax=Penstemon davidsonii TaxID=160366 RepID=A0ABR0CM09_9LAMI|nr:hypothetical protein RD792_017438 [Penstemon davidsonii]